MTTVAKQPLPTYADSIKGFVPPPCYLDSISVRSQIKRHVAINETFYYTQPIEFIEIQELDQSGETELNTDRFVSAHFIDDIITYRAQTPEEIRDMISSIQIALGEKLTQIDRNTLFVYKRVISKSDSYYIDNLRVSTLKDFAKIRQRILYELSTLKEDIEFPANHFNSLLRPVLEEINTFERILKHHKHLSKEKLNQIYKKLDALYHKLAQIRYNLNLIQEKVRQLTSDEDVAYVLKERVRVYNSAKQIVENQQRVCSLHGNC